MHCFQANIPLGNPKYLVSSDQIKRELVHKKDGFYYMQQQSEPVKAFGICYCFCAVPRDNDLKNVPFLPVTHNGKSYRVECYKCLLNQAGLDISLLSKLTMC